jgi:microcystin-dependent protein
MSAPFVAEIRIFACNFAPTGWAQCNGQLLPISQNTALFSLIGTFYGGDGKSTFALPNLQDSVAIHQGQGQGLSDYALGQQGGSQFITLLQTEMPLHNHMFGVTFENGTQGSLTPTVILARSVAGNLYQTNTTNNIVQLDFRALAPNGSSLPHNNILPYQVLNYCIAMQGVFPSRP